MTFLHEWWKEDGVVQMTPSLKFSEKEDLRQLIVKKSESIGSQDDQFVEGIDKLAALLARYDPEISPLLISLDLKGQDLATYFFTAYSSTHDFDRSIMVYKTVRSLVRYILLSDRYYEVGDRRYRRIARGILQSIRKAHDGHLGYSIDFALEQCWPFWDFEKLVKQRMLNGNLFSDKELRYYNLFKSSDAPILYCNVLDNELENFNPNVAKVFHYNQALLDILDDYADVKQDLREKMPNIFILASSGSLKLHDPSSSQILNQRSLSRVMRLVNQYRQNIAEISLETDFRFLKLLSDDYLMKIDETLTPLVGIGLKEI